MLECLCLRPRKKRSTTFTQLQQEQQHRTDTQPPRSLTLMYPGISSSSSRTSAGQRRKVTPHRPSEPRLMRSASAIFTRAVDSVLPKAPDRSHRQARVQTSDEDEQRRSVYIALALPPDYLDAPPSYTSPIYQPTVRRHHSHSSAALNDDYPRTIPQQEDSSADEEPRLDIDWTAHFNSLQIPPSQQSIRDSIVPVSSVRSTRDFSTLSKPFEASPESPVQYRRPLRQTVQQPSDRSKLLPPPPIITTPVEPMDVAYFYDRAAAYGRRG